ncbi:MAG TPA: DUF3108 domain-containing protein [Candidatus Acidoferrales bacterium]|nr:DUF3108 domain-containing protein [Candidatus Acidoferrales bacterium]
MPPTDRRSRRRPPVLALAGFLILAAGLAGIAQSSRPAKTAPKSVTKAVTHEAAVPFNPGEHLSFRVIWSKFSVNAATIQLAVVERRDFFGRIAWHFRALAQTIDTMHIVYPLDDQIDSYTDAAQLDSIQYEMYLHEQGKTQTNSWRLISDGSPSPPHVAAARVLPGTRDPISLLYMLRAADWKGTPELRAPVFDGKNLYEVVAHLESSSDQAVVPAGQFPSSKISVRVYDHGHELSTTRFNVWLAQDATRTPVLIESELPIGTARLEMTAKN